MSRSRQYAFSITESVETEFAESVASTGDWDPEDLEGDELLRDYLRAQQQGQPGEQVLDVDVIDAAGDQVGPAIIVPVLAVVPSGSVVLEGSGNTDDQGQNVAGPSTKKKFPPGGGRIQSWVDDNSTCARLGEYFVVQLIELCNTKLPNWIPTWKMTVVEEKIEELDSLSKIMALLTEDDVPEAIMMIIDILSTKYSQTSTSISAASMKGNCEEEREGELRRYHKLMLTKVLKIATNPDSYSSKLGNESYIKEYEELEGVEMQRTLETLDNVFESDYFADFSMEELKKSEAHKYHVILDAIQACANDSFKSALEWKTAKLLELGFASIQGVVEDANRKNNLFMSTEQQCKLTKKVYKLVRKTIYERGLKFFADNGFEFCISGIERESLDGSIIEYSSMESSPSPCSSQESTHSLNEASRPLADSNSSQDLGLEEPIPPLILVVEPLPLDHEVGRAIAAILEDGDEFIPDEDIPQASQPNNSFYEDGDGYVSVSPTYSISLPRMSPPNSMEDNSQGRMNQFENQSLALFEFGNESVPLVSQPTSLELPSQPRWPQSDPSSASDSDEEDGGLFPPSKRYRLE